MSLKPQEGTVGCTNIIYLPSQAQSLLQGVKPNRVWNSSGGNEQLLHAETMVGTLLSAMSSILYTDGGGLNYHLQDSSLGSLGSTEFYSLSSSVWRITVEYTGNIASWNKKRPAGITWSLLQPAASQTRRDPSKDPGVFQSSHTGNFILSASASRWHLRRVGLLSPEGFLKKEWVHLPSFRSPSLHSNPHTVMTQQEVSFIRC